MTPNGHAEQNGSLLMDQRSNTKPGMMLIEREDALPVVLHADDGPAVLLCLIIKRRREGADLSIGQALRRTVGVFPLPVVMQHQHHQPRTVARSGVFQHLSVPGRVTERCVGTPTNLQMNVL